MSVQSDIEMIYIQSMEAYARRNHISIEETVQLFLKNRQLNGHIEKALKVLNFMGRLTYER